MPTLNRVVCEWTGSVVTGGGISTFYFADAATGYVADLLTLFDSIKSWLPTGGGFDVPGTGDRLDAATGDLVGAWTDGTAGGVGFSGGAEHAAGVGCRIAWGTGTFANGRRVRGSTFLVPLTRTAYDNNGTLTSGALEALQDAVDTFMGGAGADLVIWSRPVGGAGGGTAPVTSGTVVDKVSWLRSRRT